MARAEIENGFANEQPPGGFADGRAVAKAFFERYGVPPQAVGMESETLHASVDTENVYINLSGSSQKVYRRGDTGAPINLLPGDVVLGGEFVRYTKLYGGPLEAVEFKGAEGKRKPVFPKFAVHSRADAMWFSQRQTHGGNRNSVPRDDRFGTHIKNKADLAPAGNLGKNRE